MRQCCLGMYSRTTLAPAQMSVHGTSSCLAYIFSWITRPTGPTACSPPIKAPEQVLSVLPTKGDGLLHKLCTSAQASECLPARNIYFRDTVLTSQCCKVQQSLQLPLAAFSARVYQLCSCIWACSANPAAIHNHAQQGNAHAAQH